MEIKNGNKKENKLLIRMWSDKRKIDPQIINNK